MKTIKVGIVGYGTVGRATADLLAANADAIAVRCGARLEVAVVCRRSAVPPDCRPLGARVCSDWNEVIAAPDVNIVVETMGGDGEAREVICGALKAGKPVVTANKSLIAGHAEPIFALAAAQGLPVGIEATSGGGIPIVRVLREAVAGDCIVNLYGILNGTANYILTRMERAGLEFAAALSEAQAAGYAEADPSFDIDGVDAREKLCILTRLAFHARLHPSDVPATGIRQISQVDLQYAKRLGGRVRLVAAAERMPDGVAVSVRPWLVPENSMLGKVEGVFNAIFVEGERGGTQMFYGRGAGGAATSTAIAADLIDIAAHIAAGNGSVHHSGRAFASGPSLPLAECGPTSGWYLRLEVRDRPGILAKVAAILAEEDINIDSVLQEPHMPKERLSFVITVEPTREATIQRAVSRVNGAEFLCEPVLLVRIAEG